MNTTDKFKMKQNNTQKINKVRKLKKKHIWPSILTFLFYIALLNALFCVSTVKLVEDIVQTKFEEATTEAEYIGKLYDSRISSDSSKEEVLSDLAANNSSYNRLALLGKDHTILESHGDITVDLHNEMSIYIQTNNTYYFDTNGDQNWISDDGEFHVSVKKILKAVMKNISEKEEGWLKQPVYSASYWTDVEVASSEERLLVPCELIITGEDFVSIFALAVMFLVLFTVLAISLVIKIISRIRLQHQMYQLFYYDTVTKGKNWIYFLHYAEKLLTSRWQAAKTYAIIDLQLKRYRSFCSCYGVNAGEELLKLVNSTINQEIDKKELCARYAKANFALLLTCNNEEECKKRVEYLISKLSMTTMKNHLSFHAGIYMNYSVQRKDTGRFYPRTNVDIAQSYTYASEARASLEENEENAIAVFDQKMVEKQQWVNWVENAMEKAMANEEFEVYLQPKYDPKDDQLVGAEALVRWNSPEKGFLTPYKFIPIFENNGFIMKLDDYMVSHVAKLQSQWIKEGKTVVPVSVNISRAHFTTEHLAEHLCELVDYYQTPHEVIEIELTESAFFDDKKVLLHTVKKLKEYGFELSMDDFGAGYSSLNTLKDLPLDVLKLDADFFRGEDQEKRGDIIVGETIQLAKCLNMRTVAEGIETKEQVDFLAGKGCDMIQGYFYAKPMPVKEYEERAFSKYVTSSGVVSGIGASIEPC
ncbi:EAL domain-containing protein [Anaerosporobacter faecicola]|uniref:EAL domain-containing protein n=1 Tax=Anaerosporobacter faecicola TaxID=2718714 RepID=UPI00143ACC4F|nr:GGDEF domain-containing phosphodiesterase [Anaerosporobacter faecicola]